MVLTTGTVSLMAGTNFRGTSIPPRATTPAAPATPSGISEVTTSFAGPPTE